MIPAFQHFNSVVAVVGLGASGMSAARALKFGGARVLAWDDDATARARGAAMGLDIIAPSQDSWALVDKVIWSPGIARDSHPNAEMARALSIPLVCDVDLLCEHQDESCFVAVTGTNGKSTTTVLIAHILRTAGRQVAAGGNLGVPAMDLPIMDATGTYVLELSSYQLELVPNLRAQVAVWLNISADHLSRHGGLTNYINAKKRIFDQQAQPATVVISDDDPHSAQVFADVARDAAGEVIRTRVGRAVAWGAYVLDGILFDAIGGNARAICDLSAMPGLAGVHNYQNAVCAYAATRALKVDGDIIIKGLKSFSGLSHRQQKVASIRGVDFVNDSKATNVTAAAQALANHNNILWIAGGRAKEEDPTPLVPLLARVRHAFLIGEAARELARTLSAHGVPHVISGDLERAVYAAADLAEVGDTVLLSPACASQDQFDNFEHRGKTFHRIVRDLQEVAA